MGFLDTLLGRSKPVKPNLDMLFALPSAAITLEAAAGFKPTGVGSVCFAGAEGAAFAQVQQDIQALLDADTASGNPPVEVLPRDSYGYSWITARQAPDDFTSLVNDVHAVNSELEAQGFGPQLLCTLVTFTNGTGRPLALVYLYKRGTFYPFAPLPGQKRDNPLELQTKASLENDLRVESDLTRWFPLWDAPGL